MNQIIELNDDNETNDQLKIISDSVFPVGFGDKTIDIDEVSKKFDALEDKTDSYLFDSIDGPIKHGVSKKDALLDLLIADSKGLNYLKISEMINNYGTEGDYSNIILPIIIDVPNTKFKNGSKFLIPEKTKSYIGEMIILSHPDDCNDIAKRHIKKQPNFTPLLMDSLISTTDNDHWREQRNHYTEAFLPNASLKKVFYKTVERAKYANDKLKNLIKNDKSINMANFLLHEANAQLNITMFGNDNMYTEEKNKVIRDTFKGITHAGTLKDYINELMQSLLDSRKDNFDPAHSGIDKENYINGPLGRAIADQNDTEITKWGNGLLFSFAGHDTTGHSMAFLCFELARRPDLQKKLHDEIDSFFKNNLNDLKYDDLNQFPFLTRCWTEILRLWPAIPNGTFRVLQYDDYITGSNGEDVKVKKGTYVQITNWVKHRSKKLWGEDANEFNPERTFNENELWNNNIFSGYNPYSERFSPFAYPPRDCIGKNFVHMEARAVLIYLFKDFRFELDNCFEGVDLKNYYGINRGTLSPTDPSNSVEKEGEMIYTRGMPLIPLLREIKSKL